MITSRQRTRQTIRPTKTEARLALRTSERLAVALKRDKSARLQLSSKMRESEPLELPRSALNMLQGMLAALARGEAVTLVPLAVEITTQDAAELLNVSRPYVVKLIEDKQLPARKVGRFHRLLMQDVLEYKKRTDAARYRALAELTALSQKLNMGY